jgi:hypothetical protein
MRLLPGTVVTGKVAWLHHVSHEVHFSFRSSSGRDLEAVHEPYRGSIAFDTRATEQRTRGNHVHP